MIKRYWVNAPSAHQNDHLYHGVRVLADLADPKYTGRPVVRAYFSDGPVESAELDRLTLSPGWPERKPLQMKPRFVTEDQLNELVSLYHLAKTHFADCGGGSKYDRVRWAVAEYTKAHPDVSAGGAYKDLDTFTELYIRS